MNCPKCRNRNPSGAKHCLHCGTPFEGEERENLLDTDTEEGRSNMLLVFTVVAVVVIGGGMFLFGFDTYDVKCVYSEAEAAEYEAKPGWERDGQSERRRHNERRQSTGKPYTGSHDGVWCFRKKTGRVDGAVE